MGDRIRTERCPHCYAGRIPADGHTVEELRQEAMERMSRPRPEFAAKIERKRVEQAAGREQ